MTANVGSRPHPVDEDELQAYVDGLLDARRRSEVEAYLAAHPEEVERIEAYRLQNIGLHALFDDRPPATEPLPAPIDELRRDLRGAVARQRLLRKVAASVALVLGIGAVGWWWGAGLGVPPPLDREAVVARQTIEPQGLRPHDPPRPVDGSPAEVAQAGLVGWLSQRVAGGRPEWPDLRPFGLTLSGERMAAAAGGLALVLTYQGPAGRRLALHIDLNGDELPPVITSAAREEKAALYWRSGPLILGLVGGVEREELLRIAEAVTEQIAAVGPEPGPSEDGDRLLSVQSGPAPAATTEAVTRAAADDEGEQQGGVAADLARGAGGAEEEVIAEPLPESTGASGLADQPGAPPTADRPPDAEGERPGERTTEPEEKKPLSGLPPPRLQQAVQGHPMAVPSGARPSATPA